MSYLHEKKIQRCYLVDKSQYLIPYLDMVDWMEPILDWLNLQIRWSGWFMTS